MRVVTQVEELPNNTYIGINCFGWGGNIAHLIVESSTKKVDNESSPNDFPKLVLVTGRSKQGVVETLHQINGPGAVSFQVTNLGWVDSRFWKTANKLRYLWSCTVNTQRNYLCFLDLLKVVSCF